jgi:multiple sugar transport system substrate-binding protein
MKIARTIVVSVLSLLGIYIIILGPRAIDKTPTDAVVIDYWEKWTGDEGTDMGTIVNDFNTTVGLQKHIFVRYISTSNCNQKTLIATASGIPPDVAGLYDGNLVQFASRDALMPLDQLAADCPDLTIDKNLYKPVYWDACHYHGHLYALVSTPATIALIYNKKIFHDNADKLRAAGCDPDRAPQTLDELDKYAAALDDIAPDGHIIRAGFLPLEPGWYTNELPFWFGGSWWDDKTQKLTLTDPKVVAAFDWVRSYSTRLGKEAVTSFRSGAGNFDSPQNPFLSGTVAMEMQGPWMALFIAKYKPDMVHDWAAAPFPSAVPGLKNVTYAPFDTFVIPAGAKHPKEAFEFMAYCNRQDVMEKLCSLHCKNSPLQKVSEAFYQNHPNPFVRVFDDLAASPNARAYPQCPVANEVSDEIANAVQQIAQLRQSTNDALLAAQTRTSEQLVHFNELQAVRHPEFADRSPHDSPASLAVAH